MWFEKLNKENRPLDNPKESRQWILASPWKWSVWSKGIVIDQLIVMEEQDFIDSTITDNIKKVINV